MMPKNRGSSELSSSLFTGLHRTIAFFVRIILTILFEAATDILSLLGLLISIAVTRSQSKPKVTAPAPRKQAVAARPATARPGTARPTTAGPTTAGPTTARPKTAGPKTAGTAIAGPKTAGPSTTRSTTAQVKVNGQLVGSNRQVIPSGVLDGRVARRFPAVRSPVSKGLLNPSSYCYRNAILQALLHTPALFRYLGSMHKGCDQISERCVLCSLQELAEEYWNGALGARTIARTIRKQTWEHFNTACANDPPKDQGGDIVAEFAALRGAAEAGSGQSDAMQFLRYLVQEQIQPRVGANDDVSYAEVFELRLRSSWTCQDCGFEHVSAPAENSDLAIALPLDDPEEEEDLEFYLSYQWNQELSIRCDRAACQAKYRRENLAPNAEGPRRHRQTRIIQAPQILFIKLERFRMVEVQTVDEDGEAIITDWAQQKVSTYVPFPQWLNLNEYAQAIEDDCLYRLDGVVSHGSEVIESGHYVASVRTYDGMSFQHVEDDSPVYTTSNGDFDEMQGPQDFDPYILVYSRM